MKVATLSFQNEIEPVQSGIDLLSKSVNALDLCKRLVHADFMQGNCTGVQIFLLDQNSIFVDLASYGRVHTFTDNNISAWDDTVISRAVRSRKVATEHFETGTLVALPTEYSDVVTGAMLFKFSNHIDVIQISGSLTAMLARLAGIFLDTKGFSLKSNSSPITLQADNDSMSLQELTTRQIQILGLVAEGLTNQEIAGKVLLSESTVRQETIRIFRILKCHNRAEAVVKARAVGIISSVSKVSP